MKVLMLSTDAKILEIGSPVYVRMREYAGLVEELHVVILCGKKIGVEFHDGNLHIYPTNSEKKIQRLFDGYRTASNIISTRTISFITCQDPFELGVIGARLKKTFNIKLQLQVHTDFASPFFAAESLKNRTRVLIAWKTLVKADGIRVVSQRIKKSLTAHGIDAQKISVLPIFIDIDAIKHAEKIDLHARFPQFKKIILMASRLTHEKQVAWACTAISPILEKHPDLGVIILGDGPDRIKLESFSFVHTIGWADDVVPYMKGADLFLNTSLYEGYGRTLIEAAASGILIVTTDVGIAPEIIYEGANGTIIPPHNAQALRQALLDTIEGRVTLHSIPPPITSKENYLKDFLKTWEQCV